MEGKGNTKWKRGFSEEGLVRGHGTAPAEPVGYPEAGVAGCAAAWPFFHTAMSAGLAAGRGKPLSARSLLGKGSETALQGVGVGVGKRERAFSHR